LLLVQERLADPDEFAAAVTDISANLAELNGLIPSITEIQIKRALPISAHCGLLLHPDCGAMEDRIHPVV
jgi:hypothetical protein